MRRSFHMLAGSERRHHCRKCSLSDCNLGWKLGLELTQKADHMFWGRFSEFWYQASGEPRSHKVVPGVKVVWMFGHFSFCHPPSSMLLLRSVSFSLLWTAIFSSIVFEANSSFFLYDPRFVSTSLSLSGSFKDMESRKAELRRINAFLGSRSEQTLKV